VHPAFRGDLAKPAVALAAIAMTALLGGCGGEESVQIRPPPARTAPPPDSIPTRPIGEPLVFRLDGSDPTDVSRYTVIWKLNRDSIQRVPKGTSAEFARYRGDYALQGFDIAEFNGVSRARKPGCFEAKVDEDGERERGLDRVLVGGWVKVMLRPLTPPRVKGQLQLGRKYRFNVRLRFADPRLRSADAKRQLATIGC
jgi:hypothetical protein